jgi:hypothetical protein
MDGRGESGMKRRDVFKSLMGLIALPAFTKIGSASPLAGRAVLGSVVPRGLSTIGFTEVGLESLVPTYWGNLEAALYTPHIGSMESRFIESVRPAITQAFPKDLLMEETEKMKHKEAFCLMWYECEECHHRERIWNSRDGVTPFGAGCPSCGKLTLYHRDFHDDVMAPEHKLHKGQRFWRDGTPEEAVAIVRKRLELADRQGKAVPQEYVEQMLEWTKKGLDEWTPGWPRLDIHEG